MYNDVGMTGTRNGMTDKQKDTFMKLLLQFEADWLHHGDCVGADANAHDLGTDVGMKIHIHPPINDEYRAYCKGTKSENKKGYFQRNRTIVNLSEVLIGTPVTARETKGGTWYTINYTKKQGKPVYVVNPDGSFAVFNVKYEADWK